MASKNHVALGDNKLVKMIVEQAHEEVSALARRYVAIINTVLAGEADGREACTIGSPPNLEG